MPRKQSRRSDRLMTVLREYRTVTVITHDTPDPDAIAAGWALYALVRQRLALSVRLIGGGAVMRAENVHMVKLLQPPIELVNDYTPETGSAVVLVDCSPEGANHLLGGGVVRPVAVIDHHKPARALLRVRHRDIRPRAAAAATIAATYLREQAVSPSPELATALLYAVRTEALGRRAAFTRSDRGIIAWLAQRADHQKLSEIENAPLPRSYFEELMLGLGSTFLHGDSAVCFIPRAAEVEIVGEMADLLIRGTDIHRVLCGAVVDGDLVISARTEPPHGDAVRLISQTVRGLGHCGGHASRAGGRIIAEKAGGRVTQQVLEEVKERWLRACGVEEVRAVRLVTKREILDLF